MIIRVFSVFILLKSEVKSVLLTEVDATFVGFICEYKAVGKIITRIIQLAEGQHSFPTFTNDLEIKTETGRNK